MEQTLKELVDDLPTESLELFVHTYEAGEVGGFGACGMTRAWMPNLSCRCPRASLGFDTTYIPGATTAVIQRICDESHPAGIIEKMAENHELDTAALYDECVWAIAERDAQPSAEPAETATAT